MEDNDKARSIVDFTEIQDEVYKGEELTHFSWDTKQSKTNVIPANTALRITYAWAYLSEGATPVFDLVCVINKPMTYYQASCLLEAGYLHYVATNFVGGVPRQYWIELIRKLPDGSITFECGS